MKPRHSLFLVAALLTGLGSAVVGIRLHSTQRDQTQLLTRQNADATRQLTALLRQRDGVARDLALAERQLSRLPAISLVVETPATLARDSAAEAWLARTQQLRSLDRENPAVRIPEMQLLTAEDWVRVAQHATFDTEAARRQTLAALRTAAKVKFVTQLSSAAQKWTLAAGLERHPDAVVELTPYFESPVDPAILQRFEIVPESSPRSRVTWRAREIAAIDEDYDTRHSVEATGSQGWSGAGPLTWNDDYTSRVQGAFKAYASAQPGSQPPSISQVIPYISPPLPPVTLEKLLKAERERPR